MPLCPAWTRPSHRPNTKPDYAACFNWLPPASCPIAECAAPYLGKFGGMVASSLSAKSPHRTKAEGPRCNDSLPLLEKRVALGCQPAPHTPAKLRLRAFMDRRHFLATLALTSACSARRVRVSTPAAPFSARRL